MQKQQEKQHRSELIINKLVAILSDNTVGSVVDNKAMFVQILNALDQPTIDFLLLTPDISEDDKRCLTEEAERQLVECQELVFKTVVTHYLNCNPILGNYTRKIGSFVN
jgi:3',5'-cyclic AMP phosphodiesterase CpdA